MKREHFLWQLFNIEKDMETIDAELEDDRKGLEEVSKTNEECDLEVTTKTKEHSGYLKKMTLCEKSIAKKKLELDKKVNHLSVLQILVRLCCSKYFYSLVVETYI